MSWYLQQLFSLIWTLSSECNKLTSTKDIRKIPYTEWLWVDFYTLHQTQSIVSFKQSMYARYIVYIHTLSRSELEAGSIWSSMKKISGVSMLTAIAISLEEGFGVKSSNSIATANQ